MASAAKRVFAITEILEQILIDCKLNTRDLFLLQTVSRSFHHAINGSTPLLRMMEILHKPTEQKRYRVSNPILWFQQLELRVRRYKVEVLAPASPRNGGTGWKMNVHVTMDVGREDSVTSVGSQIGVKSSKSFENPLDGSWRRMKITRFPVVIEVPLYINYMNVLYEETAADPTGQMTLGDLADLVETVRARSEEQHRARAAEFQLMNQDEDDQGTQVARCQVS